MQESPERILWHFVIHHVSFIESQFKPQSDSSWSHCAPVVMPPLPSSSALQSESGVPSCCVTACLGFGSAD